MRLKVVPKNLQVILLQPRHPIQTQGFLLAADCWYRDAHFLNEMQLICACLSERKIYNDLVEHFIAGHLIRTPYSLFKTNNSSKMSPTTCTKDHIQSFLLAAYYNSFMLLLEIESVIQTEIPTCAFEENETVSYSRSLQSNNIFSPHRVHTVQRNWETLQQGECKNTIVGLELQVGSNQTGLCSQDSSFSQREGFVFILW